MKLPLILYSAMILGLVASSRASDSERGAFVEQTRIAVLLAMDEDFRKFSERGKNPRQISVGGVPVTLTEIEGKKIALAKIGRGPSKAATSALGCLLGGDDPWYVFTVTPAAGLCGQNIGEIVIPAKVSNAEGEESIETKLNGAVSSIDPAGQLCSVGSFISSNDIVKDLLEKGNCLVDMNAYWVSEVARGAGSAHIPIRVISDDAGGEAGEQFRSFAAGYEGQGADFLLEVLRDLPVPGNSVFAHRNISAEVEQGRKKTIDTP